VADTLTAQANQIVDEKQWHAMLSFVKYVDSDAHHIHPCNDNSSMHQTVCSDFADLNEKQQAQVVHLLVRSMKRMCTLATNADVVEDTRTEYRSAVKRYAFLLASLVPIGEQLEATAADQVRCNHLQWIKQCAVCSVALRSRCITRWDPCRNLPRR